MARTDIAASLVVTRLAADLPIPPEATTSRVVVNNDAVRVIEFAMAAGQELTDHSAPRPVVVQMLEGSLDFHTLGKTATLVPGDVVYLAPDERHGLVATAPSRFCLVMVMMTAG